MRDHLRRAAVLAIGVSVALTSALGAPVHAAEADRVPARAGATWLTGELTSGLMHNQEFDVDDYGLTIDAALGLAEVGKERAVARIARAVASHVPSYTTGADFASSDVYAGATAKAAVLALVAGKDPKRFGGVDLVAQLEGLVAESGRITDRSEFGDFSNVVGQAYAAWALSSTSSKAAGAVVGYLLQQQCAAGYFRLNFAADPTAPDQTCDGAARRDRAADTDATAIATLALREVKVNAKVRRAIESSSAWLAKKQRGNGGFGGGTTTARPNTNSTGLAGWVLRDLGYDEAAARAAAFVRSHQVQTVGRCTDELADEVGAIAYDARALRSGEAEGITESTRDQWRRAGAQALPVLTVAPKADGRLAVSARATAERVQLRVTGVAPGERTCVTGAGSTEALTAGWSGARVSLRLPGSGAATYRVSTADGQTAKVVVDLR